MITTVTVLYWRDIPALVEAVDGNGSHKQPLGRRFQELIDMVAMRTGDAGTDAYLEQWRKGRPEQRDGGAAAAAAAAAAELELDFDAIRAAALAGCR